MKLFFVDTNYILRFLIPEEISKHQHRESVNLFQNAALKKVQIYTSVVVFFEVYWTLSSAYKYDKPKCIDALNKILSMDFFEVEGNQVLIESITLFKNSSLDLADCYNLLYSRRYPNSGFMTFDKKLQKYI